VRITALLARFVTSHRLLVTFLLIGITAFASYGFFSRRTPTIDTEGTPKERRTPRVQLVNDEFGFSRTDCLLVIEVEDLYTRDTIVTLRAMVDRLEDLPYIGNIVWADRVPILNLFGLAEPLFPPADGSSDRFRAARQRAEAHPLVHSQLISADSHTLLMLVTFEWIHVIDDAQVTDELLKIARHEVADLPGTRIRLTGPVPLYLGFQQALDRNQTTFYLIGFGLDTVLAMILFRGFSAVFIVAFAPILGVFWTLGIINFTDGLGNPLTITVLPVLLAMIGLTDGIHIMVHVRRQRAAGKEPREAARSAIEQVGLACALTSLTTAVGFASLMLAKNSFVSEFGQSCAMGVVITFLAVVTVIPLLTCTRLGKNIHIGQERDLIGRGMQRASGFMDWVLRWSRPVTIVGVVLTLLMASTLMSLRPDDLAKDSQPAGSEVYQAMAHCDEAFGGIEFAQVIVTWNDHVEATSPGILEAVVAAENTIAAEPLLKNPLSLHSLLSSFPQQGDDAQRQMTFLPLLPPPIRDNFYNAEHQQTVITMRVADLGVARYYPVFERLKEQLKKLDADYPDFEFTLSGNPVERSGNLYQIVMDLVTSLGTASVIIFIVLTLVYRSLRIGLVTVIPNMFPLMFTGAVLALTGSPLNVAAVCAFTVCLGIAVDDTIHFMTRYHVERDAGYAVDEALKRSFTSVGTVLVMTTLILVAGTSTVLLSDLAGHRSFAMMAICTIGSALVGDLVILPAMLSWFRGKEDDGDKQVPTDSVDGTTET
jgi:predicted RND superfamily exporter protein